jgi:hypothetical protein
LSSCVLGLAGLFIRPVCKEIKTKTEGPTRHRFTSDIDLAVAAVGITEGEAVEVY